MTLLEEPGAAATELAATTAAQPIPPVRSCSTTMAVEEHFARHLLDARTCGRSSLNGPA